MHSSGLDRVPPVNRFLILLLLTAGPVFAAPAVNSTEDDVQAVFAELKAIKGMSSSERYTLVAGGTELSGWSDDFLRRRTAAEISASGLSCGCGDYAFVFTDRIEARGFETLLVDSAELSSRSLANGFAGHSVVAIRPRDDPGAPWWLVDSTARTVLSRDWSPKEKTFFAGGYVYAIGYCGSRADYPVRSPEELKRFYAATLAAVPPEVFARSLYRFHFQIDPSLVDDGGAYLNPRIPIMVRTHAELLAKHRIEPIREIRVLLVRGNNDATGDLKWVDGKGWVSRVGLKSACSPNFVSYLEREVRSRADPAPKHSP
jgi:hypothetical protein